MVMSTSSGTQTIPLEEVPTPALVVDAVIARRNIDRMAGYVAEHGLKLRPHTKTHKSRTIARLQIDAGAVGLTVAKVGEAEQMAEACDDLLMAYPAVDRARCDRLAQLAHTKTVRVAIDSAFALESLAGAAVAAGSTIGLLVDLDVGMGRTGVANPDEALALARLIAGRPGVRLDGLMCYPGQVWEPADQQAKPLAAVAAKLQETIDLWAKHGLEAAIVSGGSTPAAFQSHLVPPLTEIRPGTYVFNDMNTVRGGYCTPDDCAARIVCTVISDAVKGQVVIDGGTKTFTSDACIPARDSGHGLIVEYPGAKITRLSEEHGQVDVTLCDVRPKVGERISVIPNHICPCVNLQDRFWWLEGRALRPITVDARGKLS
ncbi:alanine racemase [Singulisphaera sp. Ch08]|uniref:Alanine racemase n=1 Tax=Singulisphaera sp. Ch08 TaxID=3120278 RepID=A0AAU7CKC1_9BACT